MENTSGHGKSAVVPQEIQRWNWGAFLLNWIWGIGNGTYIAFLCLVPLLNLVMVFVLGAKGSEWAWRKRRWRSVEHFKKVQRNWTLAGLGVYAFAIVCSLCLLGLMFGIFGVMKQSGAYRLSLARVRSDEEAVEALGTPITPGWWIAGNVEISGPRGSAAISFPVSGPRARGRVYVDATKDMGRWRINRLELRVAETGRYLDIAPGKKPRR